MLSTGGVTVSQLKNGGASPFVPVLQLLLQLATGLLLPLLIADLTVTRGPRLRVERSTDRFSLLTHLASDLISIDSRHQTLTNQIAPKILGQVSRNRRRRIHEYRFNFSRCAWQTDEPLAPRDAPSCSKKTQVICYGLSTQPPLIIHNSTRQPTSLTPASAPNVGLWFCRWPREGHRAA
jgi:hypothetical protein